LLQRSIPSGTIKVLHLKFICSLNPTGLSYVTNPKSIGSTTMQLTKLDPVNCDVLIIGGGGAALRAAISAREHGADVLVVSKARVGFSNNTYISAATFAAAGVQESEDWYRTHLRDTIVGGRFVNDQILAAIVTEKAVRQVHALIDAGVNFAEREDAIAVDRAPGHSHARHIRAEPRIGRSYMLPLLKWAGIKGVRFADRVTINRLYTSGGRIAGASGISDEGGFAVFRAKCIVLATGGYAHIYRNTNNAAGITGDGQALAFEVGVPMRDMEFVQFYPTSMGKFGTRGILYELVVFREGAKLRNARGEDIIVKHGLTDPMKITRDRVSQAVMREINDGLGKEGGVVLDLSPISEERLSRLPLMMSPAKAPGQKSLIVTPTTHFCMGGVVADVEAETSIPNLYAAGEICGGIHGANRLGGNALTEVWTMGGIAGEVSAREAKDVKLGKLAETELAEEKTRLESIQSKHGPGIKDLTSSLKEIMWANVGVIRDRAMLTEALNKIEEIRDEGRRAKVEAVSDLQRFIELQNMLPDFPEEDNQNWLQNILIRKESEGMSLETVPVNFDVISKDELIKPD
jgi:succinate dehydrogenase/fumarate reductase flavoprotein subunit